MSEDEIEIAFIGLIATVQAAWLTYLTHLAVTAANALVGGL